MIAIIDYGVGNLFSISASLAHIGAETVITADPEVISKADRIILPGVGAFGDAANKLKESGLFEFVKQLAAEGKPLLGICLGMQLLFERSYEYGVHEGLGLIKGDICPLEADISSDLKVPQIGWNKLSLHRDNDPLMKYTSDGDYVYFVHSFYGKNCEDSLVASVEYDVSVPAVVRSGNVWGAQFHPEKSGNVGLAMLKAFNEI